MPIAARRAKRSKNVLQKCLTGIHGLDEITAGGLPRGRPTLVTGGPGCGKTVLAMEFLVRGSTQFNEPGVFLAFEETATDLTQNVASLGFDLQKLCAQKKLFIDYIRVQRHEIEETGEYNLEGLFVRLEDAIRRVGAKRVVLDTLETLFSGLSNTGILRAEIRRLFLWLKERNLTAIITAERGGGSLTRHGLEEYVSDCVIVLDHRVDNQISTRTLRVVKYRGSTHGTNDYPFLIDEQGISVLPVTSLKLAHAVTSDRFSSGVPALDTMLGGKGYFRASSILVSGMAGTGKTSLAAHFVLAAAKRGERAIFFSFEESPLQIMRNMRSIGLDLAPYVKRGLLQFHASRPTLYGIEMHLVAMHKAILAHNPTVVVVEPISNLMEISNAFQARSALTRLIDFLKARQTTALMTSLMAGTVVAQEAETGISSIIDTWIMLRDVEVNGERNRLLHLLKSRGMAHSNQVREFLLTPKGIKLIKPYIGPGGVLTGSARLAQENRDQEELLRQEQEFAGKKSRFKQHKFSLEAQIQALRAELAAGEAELQSFAREQANRERRRLEQRGHMERYRGGAARGPKVPDTAKGGSNASRP